MSGTFKGFQKWFQWSCTRPLFLAEAAKHHKAGRRHPLDPQHLGMSARIIGNYQWMILSNRYQWIIWNRKHVIIQWISNHGSKMVESQFWGITAGAEKLCFLECSTKLLKGTILSTSPERPTKWGQVAAVHRVSCISCPICFSKTLPDFQGQN